MWAAVDQLTHSSRVPVERAVDADWLSELNEDAWGVCSVPAYRAATARSATIPSLWDQATTALTTGSEGGTGSTPLRERSPADLDLMEIRSIIRHTVAHELAERDPGLTPDGVPAQIRRLASVVAATDPDSIWWWEYRFASWARLLGTYLRALEHTPKPTRLRNTPCPLCHTRQMRIDQDGDAIVVPPLVVDFRDGYVRAARCEACSATWFRGAELLELAQLVGSTPEDGTETAIA